MDLVAFSHRDAGSEVAFGTGLEVGIRRDQQAVVPADQAEEPLTVLADPRPDLVVVEPGTDRPVQLHLAPHALHHPEDLAVRSFGSSLAHGEAVEDPGLAAPRPEGRLQDQGAVHVSP